MYIYLHTYISVTLGLLEYVYTYIVSWFYLYYIKSKVKFEGVQWIVAYTKYPSTKYEQLTSFWVY